VPFFYRMFNQKNIIMGKYTNNRDFAALAKKYKCDIEENTLGIYVTIIGKNKHYHEAVKDDQNGKDGWLVFMKDSVKFFENKELTISPYRGNFSELKKLENHHRKQVDNNRYGDEE